MVAMGDYTSSPPPFLHFSVDDVFHVWRELNSLPSLASAFDHPFLAFWKRLHDQFGVVVSLFCFYEDNDFNLSQINARFAYELALHHQWLKWGFHSRNKETTYDKVNPDQASIDYALTIQELIRLTGVQACIDPVIRLHYLRATKEVINRFQHQPLGIVGLLAADDNRLSYALNEVQVNQLNQTYYYYDEETHLSYFKSALRFENKTAFDLYKTQLESFGCTYPLVVFTHEHLWNSPEIQQRVIWFVEYAATHQIPFKFPFDLR